MFSGVEKKRQEDDHNCFISAMVSFAVAGVFMYAHVTISVSVSSTMASFDVPVANLSPYSVHDLIYIIRIADLV